MKKNKTLRAAGILFLATMLTTCMTAGTFAKYTTGDSANDSARVAKFGVIVTANGTLFGEEYAAANDTSFPADSPITYSSDANKGTVQVNAQGTNVVAPGTKNETGLGYSITGTPEVDVQVTATKSDVKDVYLKAGTYAVMTSAQNITSENFDETKLWILNNGSYIHPTAYNASADYYKIDTTTTLAEDYYPIEYNYGGNPYTSIEDIADDIDAIDAKYQANTDLSTEIGTETITWEWKFENNDGADTILGDIAAESTVVKLDDTSASESYVAVEADTDYSINVSLGISITVEQID